MNYKKENWVKVDYSEQFNRIRLAWDYRGDNRTLMLNRVICYLQYTIEDPKNNDKVEILKPILEKVQALKNDKTNKELEKTINAFFNPKTEKKDVVGQILDVLCPPIPKYNQNIPITIYQYNQNDELIDSYTGSFLKIFKSIQNPAEYYYRIACLNTNTTRQKVSDRHLGVPVSSIGGLHFSLEDYLNNYLNRMVKDYSNNKDNRSYDFYYVIAHYLWIYYVNQNIKQNTQKGFEEFINTYLANNPNMIQVTDLNEYNKVSGIYFMVLDDYKLCYVGQASKSIKSRVMRHWSRNDYFTGTGIDLYKALDTTRLYAMKCDIEALDREEHRCVNLMKERYTLNSLAGGKLDYLISNNMSIVAETISDDDFIDYSFEQFSMDKTIKEIKKQFVI